MQQGLQPAVVDASLPRALPWASMQKAPWANGKLSVIPLASLPSRLQFLDHARAIAMALGIDPHTLQHGQPDVAQRGILGKNQMLTQFQVGSASRKNGRAIIKIVDAADIRSEGQ